VSKSLAQAPPNDDFTNRIVLTGSSLTFTGDCAGATFDYDNEPGYDGFWGEPSIWWTWTAQESSPVIIERTGDLAVKGGYLAVYAATNLSPDLWSHAECGIEFEHFDYVSEKLPHGQYAIFSGIAGTSYQIQLVSRDPGPISFRWTATNSPIFRLQPRTQTVSSNASALFTVSAVGIKPFQYQWRQNGVDVPGATDQQLAIHNVSPALGGDYCVVVTSATGASTSAVARLMVSPNDPNPAVMPVGLANGTNFQFVVTGEEGRTYLTDLSTDLITWPSPYVRTVLLNTNVTTTLQVPAAGPKEFVRLTPYHPVNEVCNCNLKMIRFAIWQYAEENHLTDTDTVMLSLLLPYLPGGIIPQCPLSVYYPCYAVTDVQTAPFCWGAFHMLEEP
jgi:hypothetical protein